MEKIYKVMRNVGAASIAMGVVLITVGLITGILSIIEGAILLRRFDILGRREYACKGNDQKQVVWRCIFCTVYPSPVLHPFLFRTERKRSYE